MTRVLTTLQLLLLAFFGLPVSAAHAADEVQIYRCQVGVRTVTQDKPCKKGQEVSRQNMTRPRDPVAPTLISPVRVGGSGQPQQITYVINNSTSASRPIYRCVSPEGETYTSESPDGLARWVPAYGVAYGIGGMPRTPAYSRGGAWARYSDRNTQVQVGGYSPRPPVSYPPVALVGGMWVRDSCNPLPAAQMCSLLSDRRAEIRRKNVALQASDRNALDAEAAGIDARLRADCNR